MAASVWPLRELEPLLPAHRPHVFSQISELSLLMDFFFFKATFYGTETDTERHLIYLFTPQH